MVPVTTPQASAEEKRSALLAVLNSPVLARTDRLKNLLRFLCEAEMEGRGPDLTEYEIGVKALGQPEGYSPAENSAVRSRIHELRQRLDRFYTETSGVPLRIELPRGTYVPQFIRTEHEETVTVEEVAPVPPKVERHVSWIAIGTFFAGCVLTLFLSRAFAPSVKGTPWTPELEAIWAPFLQSKAPLTLSFESRLFVRIGSVAVRDWGIDEMARVESSPRLMGIKDLFKQPQIYENRNYADFGAVQAAFSLARLLGTRESNILLKRSSEIGPAETRDSDLIFLSKPSTDPVLRQMLARGPFVDERVRIRNMNPQPGEPAEYVSRPDAKDPDRSGERYLLITMMPGQQRGRRILSLACFNSEDPWALADYMTSPEHARELYAKVHLPNGRMPDFYQVVVKAVFRAQIPIQVEYVNHRVL